MIVVALSNSATIVTVVVAFFVLLAVLSFARVLLRKAPPTWRRYRFGFFIERDPPNGN